MVKLNEYDVVRATRTLSDEVPIGGEGTIVMVYEHQSLGYEVEFMDGGCAATHSKILTASRIFTCVLSRDLF